MTIKQELTAMKKDITAISEKLEKLIMAVEKTETKVAKSSKAKAVQAKSVKKAPKAPAKKKAVKVTAIDQILNIINKSKKGVNAATLMKKTGFNQKKVTNILHRSFKAGKVKRADKGIYVGA